MGKGVEMRLLMIEGWQVIFVVQSLYKRRGAI